MVVALDFGEKGGRTNTALVVAGYRSGKIPVGGRTSRLKEARGLSLLLVLVAGSALSIGTCGAFGGGLRRLSSLRLGRKRLFVSLQLPQYILLLKKQSLPLTASGPSLYPRLIPW